MPKHLFWNASITVNGVDLSDHVESLELPTSIKELAGAAMGDMQNYSIPGIQDIGDIKITMFQDYDANKVYQTLQPLYSARTIFSLVLKADAGTTTTTNPVFTIQAFVKTVPFISGKHGDRHMMTASFAPAGVLAISTT